MKTKSITPLTASLLFLGVTQFLIPASFATAADTNPISSTNTNANLNTTNTNTNTSTNADTEAEANANANEDSEASPQYEAASLASPWSEKALRPSVDASLYQGVLDKRSLLQLIDAGDHLFNARFTSLDGVGRPMATQAIIPTL